LDKDITSIFNSIIYGAITWLLSDVFLQIVDSQIEEQLLSADYQLNVALQLLKITSNLISFDPLPFILGIIVAIVSFFTKKE